MSGRHAEDERWMRLALDQAKLGEGMTRPNPPVGAVLVKGPRAIGQGFHRKAGGPHAEVVALAEAGTGARGATLYVTLEPCSTSGRTGPCTEAVVAAGIRRVVVATNDPNPKHKGRGIRILKRHGISVTTGVLRDEAADLIEPFKKWTATGGPLVTLKLAMTLDGRIADAGGASKWITGKGAREDVQRLRRTADAILVGANTVRADDPGLLPRPSRGRKPFRVVVAGKGPLRADSRLFLDAAAARTLLACSPSTATRYQRLLRGSTAETLPCRAGKDGVSMKDLMKKLGARGLLHVLCEGGGDVAASLINADLVDHYVLYYGACLLGGGGPIAGIGGAGWRMESRPNLSILTTEILGDDVRIVAKPVKRKDS